jgi:hypothetical protein
MGLEGLWRVPSLLLREAPFILLFGDTIQGKDGTTLFSAEPVFADFKR